MTTAAELVIDQQVKPEATAKRSTAKRQPKPKAKKVQIGRSTITVSGEWVYCFFRHNSHVLRTWFEHGFITVEDGVINWSYDETACYGAPRVNGYPDLLWNSPEERFASVLGCDIDEVPYFWMVNREKAKAVSW